MALPNKQNQKKMKKRTAKLRDIKQVGFPIVKVAFKGKDGNVFVGAMMVDTGSVHCILNKSVLSLIDELCVIDGKTMDIHSVLRKGCKVSGCIIQLRDRVREVHRYILCQQHYRLQCHVWWCVDWHHWS